MFLKALSGVVSKKMGEETQCTRIRVKKLCGYKNAPICLDRAFRLLWVFLKVALNKQFVKEQEMMKLRKSGLHEGLPERHFKEHCI